MSRNFIAGVAVTLATVLLLGQTPFAEAGSSGKIYGCSKSATGAVSKISTVPVNCSKGFKPVSWSASGMAGAISTEPPKGATGAQGPIGLTGPKGEQGIQGLQGLTGLTGPKGDPGPAGVAGASAGYKVYDADGNPLGDLIGASWYSIEKGRAFTVKSDWGTVDYFSLDGDILLTSSFAYANSSCTGTKYTPYLLPNDGPKEGFLLGDALPFEIRKSAPAEIVHYADSSTKFLTGHDFYEKSVGCLPYFDANLIDKWYELETIGTIPYPKAPLTISKN